MAICAILFGMACGSGRRRAGADAALSLRPGPAMTVHVAQRARGIDQVAHALLERLGVRKAAVALAIPEQFSVAADLEHAARARL